MDTTTIQLEVKTKNLLNELKEGFNSKTYDEVIKILVRKKTKSMFGSLSKGRKISTARMLKGIRDKNERF